ncbi:MAG: hemolysin family protein [Mycobacterium sp.]|uniref:hemolysin family protein n=1 Tax=Mycobacterium sp. TaxID=1785 RepID=UPI0026037F28|nr:hemolysin family protein [Mycobacterium sp.]MDI3315782.1 hemolysin family protein [Mycobacterium sp.]
MTDVLRVLLTIVLIAANAFFVGAEFSLISARRDRLEALAEHGNRRAVTVLRAGERLPLMFAGAQLGITVSSILLGRIGQPAVADLLGRPVRAAGVSDGLLQTGSFVAALAVVVALHVLLGEMVPKNIAIAGPERAAMLLIPPYLAYLRVAGPVIEFYNRCTRATLRALRVAPKDELDVTVSTVELSEMIAESVSEGLLDREEHTRLTRALQIRNRVVADVAVPLADVRAVPAAAEGSGPTVAALQRALAETGYSRFPVLGANRGFIGYVHIKDVLPVADDSHAVVDLAAVRPLPLLGESTPLAEALAELRRTKSHLALVTAADGGVVAMVALADLVGELVGAAGHGTRGIGGVRGGWPEPGGRGTPRPRRPV